MTAELLARIIKSVIQLGRHQADASNSQENPAGPGNPGLHRHAHAAFDLRIGKVAPQRAFVSIQKELAGGGIGRVKRGIGPLAQLLPKRFPEDRSRTPPALARHQFGIDRNGNQLSKSIAIDGQLARGSPRSKGHLGKPRISVQPVVKSRFLGPHSGQLGITLDLLQHPRGRGQKVSHLALYMLGSLQQHQFRSLHHRVAREFFQMAQ